MESRDSDVAIDEILASGRTPDQLASAVSRLVVRGTDRDHVLKLLNAYLLHPEWQIDFEQGLVVAEEKFLASYHKVRSMIARGADADEMTYRLEMFHLQLVSQGRDEDDDVVLEVLDELVGF